VTFAARIGCAEQKFYCRFQIHLKKYPEPAAI